MTNTIEVNNIRIYAHHGCLTEETKIGQWYSVDLLLYTNFQNAMKSDELDETINYVVLNQLVVREMKIASKLIEHVGWRVHNAIKTYYPQIESLRVKIIKHCPPINGDVENVAITIEE